MMFDLQPTLENPRVLLRPLLASDFELLYAVACDPAIWKQHPNPDRWKREVFQNFFKGAVESRGAFVIVDKSTGKAIGSTRFYDVNETNKSVLIGYTFFEVAVWGTGINHEVKKLMLNHAFQFVDTVHFHIGVNNIRSQISITRLGAMKTGEIDVAYYGEPSKLNFIYTIAKQDWKNKHGLLS